MLWARGVGGEGGEEARAHLLRSHVEARVDTFDDNDLVLIQPPDTATQRHTAHQDKRSENEQQAEQGGEGLRRGRGSP